MSPGRMLTGVELDIFRIGRAGEEESLELVKQFGSQLLESGVEGSL